MADLCRVCPTCGKSYAPAALFCPEDGARLGQARAPAASDPLLGVEVAGQFTLSELVGIGSMARVYRAHQRSLERDVAVKVLHGDLRSKDGAVARFYREAKVAGRLHHPHVVYVLSAGALPEAPPATRGEPYMVLEFLDGHPLSAALAAAGGSMPLLRALPIILSVCDALGEAHASGVVHRDVKPENVMLVRRGLTSDFVKVVDFGVARADFTDDTFETRAGSVLGTALYVSPEGARGQRVDARADVYSIATLLYRCVAGRTPFYDENPVTVLIQHTRDQPPDVRSFAPAEQVPEPLARLIDKNLAKDPNQRCDNARQLGRELARAAGLSGIDASLIGSLRKWLAAAALVAGSLLTHTAQAQEEDQPERFRHDDDGDSAAWFGTAEFGAGVLTLPAAELCVEREIAGCTTGDLSLAFSGRPLFRRGAFAIGAGVLLGLSPTTNAPRFDPPGLPRKHSRSYFTGEIIGRYYFPLSERLEGWVGATTGLVVVNDSFRTEKGLTEIAVPGPQGVTILTEGLALGVTAGLSYPVADNWLVGGGLRVSNWFLPEEPGTDPLGDEASLSGNVVTLDLQLSLAYRSRLVF